MHKDQATHLIQPHSFESCDFATTKGPFYDTEKHNKQSVQRRKEKVKTGWNRNMLKKRNKQCVKKWKGIDNDKVTICTLHCKALYCTCSNFKVHKTTCMQKLMRNTNNFIPTASLEQFRLYLITYWYRIVYKHEVILEVLWRIYHTHNVLYISTQSLSTCDGKRTTCKWNSQIRNTIMHSIPQYILTWQ